MARGSDSLVMLGVFDTDPCQTEASMRRHGELDVDLACFGHDDPVPSDT